MLRKKAKLPVQHVWFPLLIILLGFLLQIWGTQLSHSLRYEQSIPDTHEYWRVVTGHLIHMSWQHYLINALGLILIWIILGETYTVLRWLCIFLVSCVFISAGLYFMDPELQWYVGLSGVLHAFILSASVYLIAKVWRTQQTLDLFSGILFIAVVLKLVLEQFFGVSQISELYTGGRVIVNAHFYGAIIGTICAIFYQSIDRAEYRDTK